MDKLKFNYRDTKKKTNIKKRSGSAFQGKRGKSSKLLNYKGATQKSSTNQRLNK